MSPQELLLVLELAGIFAFALDGALTAMRAAHLDLLGVIALGMVTALGGGTLRDVLLGNLPPANLQDWRLLFTATCGALVAFYGHRLLSRLSRPILLFDTAGLSLFCVTGAGVALASGAGPGQAVLLGAITAVGGGTLRDVLVRRVPTVLTATGGLYAVPALLGAAIAVAGTELDLPGLPVALAGAGVCAAVRLLGVRYDWHAPRARLRAPDALDE
ncbi:putative membrane protein YeiH [Kineococcus xinjiangensis]|uniref:Putative membrane protein YeiH n=1 Tax=Kineococcus xinjiangensis TaxID=512762 RepID=A0A2S6ITW9_9ACTN|nr:trimeric intracellular cation channel family protein [Kineococcus xinjiangensis]PPK97702.1 putative membrane protein YeiH [Kineococcus xinjiangensis]